MTQSTSFATTAAQGSVGWAGLPEEIQLQVLSALDPKSLLAFSLTSRSNRSLAQDDWLCESTARTYYPLAAARKSQSTKRKREAETEQAAGVTVDTKDESWHSLVRSTAGLRERLETRSALDYYELSTGVELPDRYAQNLGSTPRGCHHSKYSFGRLVLFFNGVNVFLVVTLATRTAQEITLPSMFSIRDVFPEEDYVYVLTTRSSFQYIFKYDKGGNLALSIDTRRADLVLLLANRRHVVAYSADSQLWIQYSVDTATTPLVEQQHSIMNTTSTNRTTTALDEHYFYQLHESTGILLIYDLDNQYFLSRISMFPRHPYVRSEVQSVNRHCYVCGPGQIGLLDGLNLTKVAMPGIPHDDDSPMWGSMLLVDLGGWISWLGDTDETIMYGLFSILPLERGSAEMLDCGRLRGPQEPVNQYETRFVSLLGDHRWLLCIMDGKVLVWRVQP